MKRIVTLFFALMATFSTYSQTYIQFGDRWFDRGDYARAVTNYDNAFKNAIGKDKQITEIKLMRAEWCAEHIKTANQAFSAKNYTTAKAEYQKVLDSNPKDSYVLSQIEKCDNALNPPKLRKATTADLTDIWDNKYGVQPQRRQNLINAGIDPDDAQARINMGQGKYVYFYRTYNKKGKVVEFDEKKLTKDSAIYYTESEINLVEFRNEYYNEILNAQINKTGEYEFILVEKEEGKYIRDSILLPRSAKRLLRKSEKQNK